MGGSASNLVGRLICRKPYQIVIFGLHSVGKTSMMYRLKTGELINSIPTIGINVKNFNLRYSYISMWDAGGGVKLQELWYLYYKNANAVVFVLDASDRKTAPSAAEKLHYLLSRMDNQKYIVLILANKQDLGNCMTEDEIVEIFCLHDSPNIKWHIQPASVKEWYGVTEGMDWLSKEVCN